MAFGIWNLFILFASLGFFVALAVPLSGVLIRFRANYNPKALQLDAEGGAQAHTGPVINSYFGMMMRVYNIEGVPGLYKGLMPTFLSTMAIALIMLPILDSPRPAKYNAPTESIFAAFIYGVAMMVISLPTTILTCRAVTTPQRLGYLDAKRALRVLFTPTERRKPWTLYLTPGLFLTEVSHIFYVVFILGAGRRFLLPSPSDTETPVSIVKLSFYVALLVLSVLVLTPLEVVSTRLAIQRNHAQDQPLEEDGEENIEYAGADEDVIGLRSEEDPYSGLTDCVQRIIHEEGFRALYRGWWLTLLAGGSQAFA